MHRLWLVCCKFLPENSCNSTLKNLILRIDRYLTYLKRNIQLPDLFKNSGIYALSILRLIMLID